MSQTASVADLVRGMGYILAAPKSAPAPSCYRLGDGTILSVLVRINHALTDASESGSVSINHSVEIHTFSPHRRKPHTPAQPNQPPTIIDQDVECTAIREEFNDYAVGGDITVSAKAVVAQVAKTDACNNEGEPVYNVNVLPVIKVVDKKRLST